MAMPWVEEKVSRCPLETAPLRLGIIPLPEVTTPGRNAVVAVLHRVPEAAVFVGVYHPEGPELGAAWDTGGG